MAEGPWLLLFIAFTALLCLGYARGRRRNRRLVTATFETLAAALGAEETVYTNIGGLIGHHARFRPARLDGVTGAEATLTLLPRQSWLYYPLSLLIRRHDRLYVMLTLGTDTGNTLSEGHIVLERHARTAEGTIANAPRLEREQRVLGGRRYLVFWEDGPARERLEALMAGVPGWAAVIHAGMVPGLDRVWLLLDPAAEGVPAVLDAVRDWILLYFRPRLP
jgi:hypothetical protein